MSRELNLNPCLAGVGRTLPQRSCLRPGIYVSKREIFLSKAVGGSHLHIMNLDYCEHHLKNAFQVDTPLRLIGVFERKSGKRIDNSPFKV